MPRLNLEELDALIGEVLNKSAIDDLLENANKYAEL